MRILYAVTAFVLALHTLHTQESRMETRANARDESIDFAAIVNT